MNAVVIVFRPARDGRVFPAPANVERGLDISRRDRDLDKAKTDLCNNSGRNQTNPAFWTWFIENPRSCGA
jgi:hypothetical protein